MEEACKPKPIEHMHGLLLEFFHEHRKEKAPGKAWVQMSGYTFNKMIAKAKRQTYEKYNFEEGKP